MHRRSLDYRWREGGRARERREKGVERVAAAGAGAAVARRGSQSTGGEVHSGLSGDVRAGATR